MKDKADKGQMALSIEDLDQHAGRGTLSQMGVTLLIGIPSTMALIAALSVYCTFQFVASAAFPKPHRKSVNKVDEAQPKLERRS